MLFSRSFFVFKQGEDLLSLPNAKSGERVLAVGIDCWNVAGNFFEGMTATGIEDVISKVVEKLRSPSFQKWKMT